MNQRTTTQEGEKGINSQVLVVRCLFRRVDRLLPKAYTVPTNFFLRNYSQINLSISTCF